MAGSESNFGNYKQEEIDAAIAAGGNKEAAAEGDKETPLEKVKAELGDMYGSAAELLGLSADADPSEILAEYTRAQKNGEFADQDAWDDDKLDIVTGVVTKLRGVV